MTNSFKLQAHTESVILSLAPPFAFSTPICQNWQELQAWHNLTGQQYYQALTLDDWGGMEPIAVHKAGTDPGEHNIFSSRHAHGAFRAWHDYYHLLLVQDFTTPSEMVVAKAQCDALREHGVDRNDVSAIWHFIAGEVRHYWRWKRFIDHKAEFVEHCLAHGQPSALQRDWSYEGIAEARLHLS